MKTHSTDIPYADMGMAPDDHEPDSFPDDILYAITRADVDKAAAELMTWMDAEYTQEQVAGAVYSAIETVCESLFKDTTRIVLDQQTPFSDAFWKALSPKVKP